MPEIKEISAGIIVFYETYQGSKETKNREENKPEREFLILHYEEGHYDFPKGHVENNESLEKTAIRETFEETGLKINIINGFKEKISYFFKDKYKNYRLVKKDVYFFLGKSDKKEVKLSHEHIGFEWLSFEDALKKLTYKSAKELLKKALEFLEKNEENVLKKI